MPLTLVQGSSPGAWGAANNGAVPSDPVSVTWGAGRTVGNLLILAAGSDGTYTDPTGWTLDDTVVASAGCYLWTRIADNTATDAPTLDNNVATCLAWAEYSGNTSTPVDVSANASGGAGAGAQTTGTTASTAQSDELAVGMWVSSSATAGITWSAHTNSFVEVSETGTSGAGQRIGLSVATKALSSVGAVESSATPSAMTDRHGIVGTYKAAPPDPLSYEQEGFRFRNDDGSEAAATWLAAQDINITRAAALNTRIRVLVNATNDPPAEQYQLEVKRLSEADSAYRKVVDQ